MRRKFFVAAITVATTAALAVSLTGPAPRSDALSSSPDFDLATYLSSSPALIGASFDVGNISAALIQYTPRNVSFRQGAPLGYKSADLINSSGTSQSLTTVASWVADARATSYSNAHTFAVGWGYETQLSAKLGAFEGSSGASMSLDYTWSTEKSVTSTETTTLIMSPQNIVVPANHSARVEEWYERGTLTADIDLVGALAGTVRITRCGITVGVPLGQLLAIRAELGLPELPTWMWVDGDALRMSNTVHFTTTRATNQLVRVTTTNLDTTTPTTTTTRVEAPSSVTPPSGADPRGPRPVTRVSQQTRDGIAKLTSCTPRTADGAGVLGVNGAISDPAWGAGIPAPGGIRFSALSGTNAPGLGLFLSAVSADGTPFWRGGGGALVQVSIPTKVTQTADGSALLGSNGLVYAPGAGARIASPDGVRFVDVSGIHVPGRAHFISAVASDGRAYWYDGNSPLRRVPVDVAIVDTADGVALLGADGNIYQASTGERIPNPHGARFVSVSGVHKYNTAIGYLAVSERGFAFWSQNGAAFAQIPLPVRVTMTADGCVLLGSDGQAYDAGGNLIPNPSGKRFVSVSGLHDWGVAFYVSAVAEDGSVYWSNRSQPFARVWI